MVELDSSLDPAKMGQDEAKIRLELACSDYIRQPNKEAFDFIAHNGHQMSILQFVELLQPHIISKEDDIRLKAITLLIDVSRKAKLLEAEVRSLVVFVCGRLSDKYSVVPSVLTGLTHLVQERELDQGTVCTVAREIFKSVDVQALHQDTRYKTYKLISALLRRNLLSLLEAMDKDFVVGYINTVDGEQDPRNLVLVFSMTVIVLQHFNIDHVEETLFDAVSCYYPIDFTPPEDTAVTVTPAELRAHLNNCFKANNKLARHTIPFLLEKFSSSVLQTRLQSCDTLKLCVVSYGVSCSEEYIALIWNSIKQEIFGGINRELCQRCLDLVSALFWVLTIPNVKSKNLDPAQFISTVFDYCKEKLEYSEIKYIKPTALILGAVVKSSGVGSGLVAEHCLDWFVARFTEHHETSVQTLTELQDTPVQTLLLEEIVTLLVEMQCEPARADAAVAFFNWNRLQELFLSAIAENKNPALCSAGLQGINQLLSIYHVTESVDATPESATPESATPESAIPDSPIPDNATPDNATPESATQLDIDRIILGVYMHLSTCEKEEQSLPVIYNNNIAEEGLHVLTVLSRDYPDTVNRLLLERLLIRVDAGDSAARRMLSRLLVGSLLIQHSPRLMRLFVEKRDVGIISLFTVALSYQVTESNISYCENFIFYQFLNLFIQDAIQEKDIEEAVLLFQEFTVALFKNRARTVDMTVFSWLFTKSAAFKPFSYKSPPSQTMLTAIYSSVLTYGSLDITFDPVLTPLDLVEPLELTCLSSDPITIRSLAAVVGLMLNRMDEGPQLEELKSRVFSEVASCDLINNKVWLCIRMCQGLVYRWEKDAERAVEMFVACLTDKRTHSHTANLTSHVLEPIYQGSRLVLYKQRFLLILIPLITPYIKDQSRLSGEVSGSLVRGICTLLLALPQSLISSHGDTLFPVILNNLVPATCDFHSLKLVQYLITNVPTIIIMQLDTLIARLCALVASSAVSVQCRAEAAKTLETCSSQLHHTHTHVHRTFVLKELQRTLSDRKRVVRKTISDTIHCWIMMEP